MIGGSGGTCPSPPPLPKHLCVVGGLSHSRSKIDFPQLLGIAEAAHLSQFLNPLHPQPNPWAPNPRIHEWRIPSSKDEQVPIPGSTVPAGILTQP